MTGPWRVRHEGFTDAVSLPSAQRVLEGLRDGEWEVTDEVRGPADGRWLPIADHPVFAAAAEDLAPPPPEPADEAKLDMNPLIDVALVLLIFIILNITVLSMRRSIELPPPPQDEGVGKKTDVVKAEDVKDRAFRVTVRMEGDKPVVRIEDKPVSLDRIEAELIQFVKDTGRKEMFLVADDEVPWGVEAKIYDAAKGAEIHQIYWPQGK